MRRLIPILIAASTFPTIVDGQSLPVGPWVDPQWATSEAGCTVTVTDEAELTSAVDQATSGSVVCLRAGTYRTTIRPRASGIIVQAYPGEDGQVVVSGAEPIPITGWMPDSDDPNVWYWDWNAGAGWETDAGNGSQAWFGFTYETDEDPPPCPPLNPDCRGSDVGPYHVQRRELLIARAYQSSGALEPIRGASPVSAYDGHVMRAVGTLAEVRGTSVPTPAPDAPLYSDYGVFGVYFVEDDSNGSTSDGTNATPVAYQQGRRPVRIWARFAENKTPAEVQPKLAVRRHGFWPNVTGTGTAGACGALNTPRDLAVRGIVFRHTNNNRQIGAVCPGDAGSVLYRVDVEFTNGTGVLTGNHPGVVLDPSLSNQTGADHLLAQVRLSFNGQMGLGGECDNCLIVDSEIHRNNWKEFNYGWEAGGTKMSFSENTTFRRVRAWDNIGPGIWFDIANRDNTIEGSWVRRNRLAGIMLEFHTVRTLVQHNVVANTIKATANGWNGTLPFGEDGGTGVFVQNASGNYIYHNTIIGNQGTGYFVRIFSPALDSRYFVYSNYSTIGGVRVWPGSSSFVLNNVFVGNANNSFPNPGDLETHPGEAHELQINELTRAHVEANFFRGNVVERHNGDAAWQKAFAAYGQGLQFPPTNDDQLWRNLFVPAIPVDAESYPAWSNDSWPSLADPSYWSSWLGTAIPNGAPVTSDIPALSGEHCYATPGAYPDALLSRDFLNNDPPPQSNCQAASTAAYITEVENVTSSNFTDQYRGKDVFVMPDAVATVIGDVELAASGTTPANMHVLGRLLPDPNDPDQVFEITGGSELILRPFGEIAIRNVVIDDQNSCLMVTEGGVFTLKSGATITARDGGFFAVREGGIVNLEANTVLHSLATAGQPVIEPGATFRMGTDALVRFDHPVDLLGTADSPIRFTRADPTEPWQAVEINGDASFLQHVLFDGGTHNLRLRAHNVMVNNVTARNGAYGLLATAAYNGGGKATPGSFAVTDSRFVDNALRGISSSNASFSVYNSEISGNGTDGIGIVSGTARIEDSSVLTNGRYGADVGSGATLIAGLSGVTGQPGTNRIANNARHQVYVSAYGNAFLGLADGTGAANAVLSGANTLPGYKLIYNANTSGKGDGVLAQANYYGSAAPPSPSSWFCRVPSQWNHYCGVVNVSNELSTDPTLNNPGMLRGAGWDGNGTMASAMDPGTLAALKASAAEGEAARQAQTAASAGKTWTPEELAQRMTALRASITAAATPSDSVSSHMTELHALSFVDGLDELGMRAANWSALGSRLSILSDSTAGHEAHQVGAHAALLLATSAFLEGRTNDAAAGITQHGPAIDLWGNALARCELLLLRARVTEFDASATAALDMLTADTQTCAMPETAPAYDGYAETLALLAGIEAITGGTQPTVKAPALALASSQVGLTLALGVPRPNPARGRITLPLTLPESATVQVHVVDLLGRRVATLFDGGMEAGEHAVPFDASAVPAGTYVVRALVSGAARVGRLFQRVTVVR